LLIEENSDIIRDEVIVMLSNEERNRLVETFNKFHDAGKVAEIYSVHVSSVYRLVRQMKDTGSVDLKTGSRGRKPSLSAEDLENIKRAVMEQPDITIHEINVKLGLSVCDETIRLKVAEMNLNYKKKRSTPRNRSGLRFRTSGNGGGNGRTTS